MLKLDLLALENWATNWQVNFNPNKCEVMKITHDKDKERTKYYISNIELKNVQNYKDLGVIISSDLSWSKHVEEIVNKANKILGLITRIVGNRNKDVFSLLYKSLVRPTLEYACPLWDPHLVKNIKSPKKSVTHRTRSKTRGDAIRRKVQNLKLEFIRKTKRISFTDRML